MYRVFIDGSAGTTGLRIRERLSDREDIALIELDEAHRKQSAARKEALNEADIVFLCLPDAAAMEAVGMIENSRVKVLDTSTAHRTNPDWVYGFPEMAEGQAEKIANAKRIAVPGCHASGMIALVRPLVDAGILAAEQKISCYSLTGYSGGGKKMIAEYEQEGRSALLDAPRPYGLSQEHKHLKEMKAMSGLAEAPVFCPVVADFYSGMLVNIGLFAGDLRGGAGIDEVRAAYSKRYRGIVHYEKDMDDGGFLAANAMAGRDDMQIGVYGNAERMLLCAMYDNLGKGASGAAIQCMNILMGREPSTGLNVK